MPQRRRHVIVQESPLDTLHAKLLRLDWGRRHKYLLLLQTSPRPGYRRWRGVAQMMLKRRGSPQDFLHGKHTGKKAPEVIELPDRVRTQRATTLTEMFRLQRLGRMP